MAKEKVTLTLDTDQLHELRALVDARSLSAAVDAAVASYLVQAKHFRAVDDWMSELDAEHGPVDAESLAWAARIVEGWESPASPDRKVG